MIRQNYAGRTNINLVYGLAYDSEGGECLWAYGGIVYEPDLRLGYKTVN